MSIQALFLAEMAIVYVLGAATWPVLARILRRLRRRLWRRKSDWDGYFKH